MTQKHHWLDRLGYVLYPTLAYTLVAIFIAIFAIGPTIVMENAKNQRKVHKADTSRTSRAGAIIRE